MSGKVFVDTNILIYAYDLDAGQRNTPSERNAKAEKILTEDLNHGQRIEGILIENPFVP